MNKKNLIRTITIITSMLVVISLAVLYFVFDFNVLLAGIVAFIFIVILLVVYFFLDAIQREENLQLEKNIDYATKEAIKIGRMGILAYDNDYQITWQSLLFEEYHLEHLNEKILNWIPELQDLLEGNSSFKVIEINDETFAVTKLNNASILIFEDISREYDYESKIQEDAYVIGMISYDNYDEAEASEDDLTFVNTNIKNTVCDYFKKFNVVYKTLKSDRLYLVMNEKIFDNIYKDRFSILNTIRKISKDAELDVTLSMAFARGSDDLQELDDTALSLLELAQTRGGDQVVVRKIGEEATFFGGNSEAREKTNKTKVRVMINAIRDLISKSSNVIIVGHKNADADCIGAAICMSNIVKDLDKEAYIATASSKIDPMINEVLEQYSDELNTKHKFVSEQEAIDLLDDNSLVIMVDHHSLDQSGCEEIVGVARRIVVIDHHRRHANLEFIPVMVYIEPSASSTCELVCEFLPYMSRKLEISDEEANIMYLGLMIDTDNFRVRTGIRTFDVAKQLRRYGANPVTCDELVQEPYNVVVSRSHIINEGKRYREGVIVSKIENGIYNRSIASQACDTMIKAKDIEAAFVIFNCNKDEVAITARSKGKVNVQVIMEKMNGGGHMTAAGLQRKDGSVNRLTNELLVVLDEYFKGE